MKRYQMIGLFALRQPYIFYSSVIGILKYVNDDKLPNN